MEDEVPLGEADLVELLAVLAAVASDHDGHGGVYNEDW